MLFERNSDGLLVEVPDTEDRREGRRVSRATFEADILFTPDEEAVRDAEEARARASVEAAIAATAEAEADRNAAIDKLFALGLTPKEIKALIK